MNPELVAALIPFNAGLLLTLLLRPLWRRHFGALATYGLWPMAPMLALATQLPAGGSHLQPVRILLSAATGNLPALPAAAADSGNGWMFAIWLLGAILVCAYFLLRRWQLGRRLRLAPVSVDAHCGKLRVVRSDFGPALVGLWNPRLVLPHDFDTRFDPDQQALVLAHECAHVAAGDLWARSLALLLAIAQWWNPLAWLALYRFIDDQELACDARVLSERPHALPTYARTLVAGIDLSPSASALMCSMHQRHPLLRRIAMLSRKPISKRANRLATVLTLICLLTAAALAWAAGSGQPATAVAAVASDYYVGLSLQLDEGKFQELGLGTLADQAAGAKFDADDGNVEVTLTVKPTAMPDQVLVNLVLTRDGTELGRPALAFTLGRSGRIEIGEQTEQGFTGVRLDVRVSRWGERVDLAPVAMSTHALIREIAGKAGLQIEDIELLPDAPMQMRLDAVQGESALQIIAETAGLKITRVGDSVRFVRP